MGVFSPAGAPSPASVTSTGAKTTRVNQTETLLVAGNEYTISFPSDLKAYRIRIRNGGVGTKLQIASASGESSTNYETLIPGVQYWEENLASLAGFELYVQSNKAGTVLEVVSWT